MLDDERPADWYDRMQAEREARLVVGARVRIVGGECRRDWCQDARGQTGTVRLVLPAAHDGHRFAVGWEEDKPGADFVSWFCAEELDPLTTDPLTRRRVGGGDGWGGMRDAVLPDRPVRDVLVLHGSLVPASIRWLSHREFVWSLRRGFR